MSARRSLSLPITLAAVMTALLLVLTVGWVLYTVYGAVADPESAAKHTTYLILGTSFIGLLLVGVGMYLVLTIKAINLGRRQSNFIDSVTHELKSPIASLKLHLQTLHRRPVDEVRRSGFYELMLEDLERLDHLINQLLDTGRLEEGRADLKSESLSLEDLLGECEEQVSARHRVPPGVIHFDVEPCLVRGPRAHLVILIGNLLDNAVKYAGDPARVEVTGRATGPQRVVVRITDNGRGIPRKLRRRIFRRFVRLGSELERIRPGTGLGLHLARAIARRIGARIRIRDRRGGSGTVFSVDLPGAQVNQDEAPAEGASTSAAKEAS